MKLFSTSKAGMTVNWIVVTESVLQGFKDLFCLIPVYL